MKASRSLWLVALAAALPASAQNASIDEGGHYVRPAFESWLATWRAENGNSWRLVIDESARSFELLHGGRREGPLRPQTEAEWFGQARHFVAETAAVHGVSGATLIDEKVVYLPLAQVNTTDKVTVRFSQSVGGVPVDGASVNVLLTTTGELLSIQNKALNGIQSMSTRPALEAGQAASIAEGLFVREAGEGPLYASLPELVIKSFEGPFGVNARLAWRSDLLLKGADKAPVGNRYWIDAQNGTLLEKRTNIHHLDVGGQVLTNASPGLDPDTPANPPAPEPMPHVFISASIGSTFADANGNFNFVGINNPISITVNYQGTYNDVQNDTSAGANHTEGFNSLQPGVNNVVVMNNTPAPDPLVTAQANCYVSSSYLRTWLTNVNPADTTLDFTVVSNTNQPADCNAFYDGVSINFFTEGGGCVNTAFSTVVAHELGHWLNDLYNTFNGFDGMGEGNADVFAMYAYDDPEVGKDFCGSGCSVRSGTNTNPFCGDNMSACYGQVHADGMPWMGAAWKVRENLNATHGDAMGDMIADSLFLGWMNGFDQQEIKSIIETQWLTLDDDDGNIDNGTPNYPDIDAGFRAQGFPGFDLTFITFQNVTQVSDTTDEVTPYRVDADLTALCAPPVLTADLHYTVDGGPVITVPMTNTGGVTWSGSIPSQTAPREVEYWISAADSMGDGNDFPAGGDSLGFRVGTITNVHVTAFEGTNDEGWTVGDPTDMATTGIWVRDDPFGTGAQPEDDHTPTGSRCWFTGQGSNGGNDRRARRGRWQDDADVPLVRHDGPVRPDGQLLALVLEQPGSRAEHRHLPDRHVERRRRHVDERGDDRSGGPRHGRRLDLQAPPDRGLHDADERDGHALHRGGRW